MPSNKRTLVRAFGSLIARSLVLGAMLVFGVVVWWKMITLLQGGLTIAKVANLGVALLFTGVAIQGVFAVEDKKTGLTPFEYLIGLSEKGSSD
jgi:hypothetical protein